MGCVGMSVTIQDVAKAAGVTVGTVSRALNNYADVNENTRQRIIRTAQELGYHPNLVARSLSSKHARSLSVCSLKRPMISFIKIHSFSERPPCH